MKQVTGLQKAAILLVLLGDEAATSVYKHLYDHELQDSPKRLPPSRTFLRRSPTESSANTTSSR